MTVLFVMESPEYLRFYDGTVRLLAERGHRVLLAVNDQNEKKPVRLDGYAADRVVALGRVPRHDGIWGAIGRGLRGFADFARYLHPRLARAAALRARMKRKVLPRGFHGLDRLHTLGVGGTRALLRAVAALERAVPVSTAVAAFVRDQRPDVVLVTPLVDAASDQVEVVKAARANGVPVAVCVASWDNLTNKGLLRVRPDRVIVWNEAQRSEAVEYHGIRPDAVAVTGAQLFDRWFEARPATTREEFCARIGLPAGRPFVLFTCSSSFISISHAEVGFVRQWIAALRGRPGLADLPVLVRPHPYNCAAWETADFSDLPDVAIWPRRAYNPIDPENRAAFFDSLYHSAAVVGINTSAMIEAAIVGRPVLSMLAGEFSGTQEGTLHFHHLLPENGGFLRIAATLDEHVAQLAAVMADPESARAETQRFVAGFIRPHGLDRPATPFVADAIEGVAALGARAPQGTPWWAPLLWPVLLAGGAYGGAWHLATHPKAMAVVRKQLSGAAGRGRKQALRASRVLTGRVRRGVSLGARRALKAASPSRAARHLVVKPARRASQFVRHARYALAVRFRSR